MLEVKYCPVIDRNCLVGGCQFFVEELKQCSMVSLAKSLNAINDNTRAQGFYFRGVLKKEYKDNYVESKKEIEDWTI